MKKKNVLNLIKYYSESNDAGFRSEAYEIAEDFNKAGDYQLSEYIIALLTNANIFTPQIADGASDFFTKIEYSNEPLPLPDAIKNDLVGVVNAIGHDVGVNKFLFQGAPGTGKTESVKQVARLLKREIYSINFDTVIDSKLGQTSKNIAKVFKEINKLSHPGNVIILFDEIDAIALDRTNSNDLREMGRATSSVLKGMDSLNKDVVLIATTNLFNNFDKALIRRFDTVVDFNRYTKDDLLNIADVVLDFYLSKFRLARKNKKLLRKILALGDNIPYPGELKNLLKTSLAFSKPDSEFDYFRVLYTKITGDEPVVSKELQNQGFSLREIEILTGVSKSQVARELQEIENE